MKETLKAIVEEKDTEEKMTYETQETVVNQDDNGQARKNEENGEDEERESGTIMKLLITKKETIGRTL